ncbi:MAG: ArdC family protein, partial [Candidatus Thiodiazotropha endolucinida]|nr:ArdC family protein [Candidatus Thiodiazotropha taylori]MCG8050225.1 ArdC family protein [Candidatus Thiodiazotropha taylori]MCW4312043.1 ArdC family protein [Candidatus Thiodiazotropha taylori]
MLKLLEKYRRDFYQEVTNKIINLMKTGTSPIRPRWGGMGEFTLNDGSYQAAEQRQAAKRRDRQALAFQLFD